MKIEKINDRQIRCTLTREDLANREIKLSELAYGTEKAKALFRDMMQVAAQDFGFEADNSPLMIEAVPVSMDSIILIITKVDEAEELDTRFSRFSPDSSSSDTSFSPTDLKDKVEGADDILGLIKRISDAKKRALEKISDSSEKTVPDSSEEVKDSDSLLPDDEDIRSLTRLYLFHSLDDAILAADVVGSIYDGPNTLFKDPESREYLLLLTMAENSAQHFNKVCNILSEYALACKYMPGLDAHLREHLEVIIADQALQSLCQLN